MKILGSADATTCVIVIIVSKKSGKASCAHFDGAKKQIGGSTCSLEVW